MPPEPVGEVIPPPLASIVRMEVRDGDEDDDDDDSEDDEDEGEVLKVNFFMPSDCLGSCQFCWEEKGFWSVFMNTSK